MRLQKALSAWREAGRKVGFFLLLAAGSAATGFAIAWPLWLFATAQRELYTIFALCLAVGGIVAAIVRAALRSRGATRDAGKPRRSALSVILAIFQAIVAVAGLYLETALLYRGLWIIAGITLVLWGALLWLLGLARRAVRSHGDSQSHKEPGIPAEHYNG
jgi:hypothetical protein